MVELINEDPKVYRIFIPLPQNPLKSLNSYLIKTEERDLLIDTGFNRVECLEALEEGLEELGVKKERLIIILTHLHSDHCGLVNKISSKNSEIYMGRVDYEYLKGNLEGNNWDRIEKRFSQEGFPQDILISLRETNQARIFSPNKIFEVAKLIDDGDKFKIGDIEFTAIMTPGHTPGHICLYIENKKILFSGDHVLFDITPNITVWLNMENALKDYMKSLIKIKNLDVNITFPAHREKSILLNERIENILEHHCLRLEDTLRVIEENPNLNAYEIASKMKWNMRGKSWSEFPDNQKWFATGETISHLDYLYLDGKLEKKEERGIYKYSIREI